MAAAFRESEAKTPGREKTTELEESPVRLVGRETSGGTTFDVVFIHGLDSSASGAWSATRNSTNSWPFWLAADRPDAAVWLVDYEAPLSRAQRGNALHFGERARNVLMRLVARGIGGRPFVVVAHSMGGLILKSMIRHVSEAGAKLYPGWLEHLRSIVFLAVPHGGSRLPLLANLMRVIFWPSRATLSLGWGDWNLRELNESFQQWAANADLPVVSAYETKRLGFGWIGLMVVPKESAIIGLSPDLEQLLPTDCHHISISKPRSRLSDQYVVTMREIERAFGISNAAPAPNARLQAAVLAIHASAEIGVETVPAVLVSENPQIAYPLVIENLLTRLRDRLNDFDPFLQSNPYYVEASTDPQKRANIASGQLQHFSEIYRRTNATARSNDSGLKLLAKKLRAFSPSEGMVAASFQTYARFSLLRLVRHLKRGYDFEGIIPQLWLPGYELNKKANFSELPLVPEPTQTGSAVFGYWNLVGARVGTTESRYEYVVLPFGRAKDAFLACEPITDDLFYEWVLPQLVRHTHFPLDEYQPGNCRIWVLLGNDGQEWYFPNAEDNPWRSSGRD